MPLLGAHMSIAGGVDVAIERGRSIGCHAIQIFTKSARQWRARPLGEEEIARFKHAREESGIMVFAHTSYLIHLGTPDEDLWLKSMAGFTEEMERCAAMGLPYLVTHPGASPEGEEAGLERIGLALDAILKQTENSGVSILLEITSGHGASIGHKFEHLAWFIQNSVHPERLGVCFDTCHAFAAGYDLRTPEVYAKTFAKFDDMIGIDRLKAVHLNDSRGELGSHVDRHEHIGKGRLGIEAFRLLLNDTRFQKLPMVLETPKGPDLKEDIENLRVLRSLLKK